MISLIKDNIVNLNVDSIVNAANSRLAPGGGVCGAIFQTAGYNELVNECNSIGYCDTGYAVITKGYNLKAKYIIHAVGPRYSMDDAQKLLAMAYYNSLKLADENNITSIAFPSISTGIYGYTITKAVPISLKAINDYFKDYPNSKINKVIICAFSDEVYNEYYKYNKYIEGSNNE